MKTLLKLIFILLLLAIIAGLVLFYTFDINSYRDKINQELSSALNRPVTIGRLETKLALIPTIKAFDISIANPQEIKDKNNLLKIDELEVTLEVMPLVFDKNVRIHKIAVQKAEINVLNTKKQNNIDFSSKSGNKGGASSLALNPYLSNLTIGDISVNQVDVRYVGDDKTYQFTLKDALIRQLKMVSFLLEYEHQQIRFSGNMDLMKLIQQQSSFVFNADIEAFGFVSKISGSIGDMKQFKNVLLNLNLETTSLSDSMAQLGVQNSAIPSYPMQVSSIIKGSLDKLNFDNTTIQFDDVVNVAVKGSLADIKTNPKGAFAGTFTLNKPYTTNNITIKPLSTDLDIAVSPTQLLIKKLTLTANRSDADIVLSMNKKDKMWMINGSVFSNYMDTNDLFVPVYAEAKQPTKSTVPVQQAQNQAVKQENTQTVKTGTATQNDVLTQLSGQIDWNLKNVKFVDGSEDYYGITARTVLSNNTLTINPLQIKTIAGVLNSVVQVKNITTAPQTQITVQGNNIALDKIKAFNTLVAGSTANIDAKLNANGLTKVSILSSLSGTAEVEVTQGKVVNKWFNAIPETLGLVKKAKSVTFTKSDMDSTLNCAVVNVKVNNGVINMDKSVAVETSVLNVLASGTVDLSTEDLSVSLLPEVSSQLAPVLLIKGKITDPKFVGIDAKSTLSNVAKEGLNRLLKIDTQTETVSDVAPKVSWCEMALGHKLKGKVVQQPKPKPVEEVKEEPVKPAEPVKLTPEEELKQQLIKSLSSVLKPSDE